VELSRLDDTSESVYGVHAVAFSPDGVTLASGSGDHTVQLWDVSDRAHPALRHTITAHSGDVYAVAFSPDGSLLATASEDRTTWLWKIAGSDGPEPTSAPLIGQGGNVHDVSFSPDGTTLATANGDNTVWLRDVSDPTEPRELASLTGHTGAVFELAYSPDGTTLATSSIDETVRLWDVDADSLARRACAKSSGELTAAEWQEYLPDVPYQRPCP
jgi:WD40 repeat protein